MNQEHDLTILDQQIKMLMGRLAQVESTLQEYLDQHVDTSTDSPKSTQQSPLRRAWQELHAARDELQTKVREQTETMVVAYEELQTHKEELLAQQEELHSQNEALVAAHQQIETDRQRYQDLFNQAPDGYLVTDLRGVIHEANDTAATMLGLRRDELVDKPLLFFFIPSDHETLHDQLARLARGELDQVRNWDLSLQSWQGTLLAASITATPIHDPLGQRTGLRWLIRDIRGRVRLERERERLLQENRDQREFLEQLMAALPIGVAVLGATDHRYKYANPYYQTHVIQDSTQIVGRTFQEILPQAIARRAARSMQEARRTGEIQMLYERPALLGPDRQETYWDVYYVPVRGQNGEIDRMLTLRVDVTRQVQTRQRIEELAAQDRAILSSMTEGLVRFDLQGNVIEMNPAALRMYAIDQQDARRHLNEFTSQFELYDLDGRLIPVDEWPLARVLRGERLEALEVQVRRTDTDDVRFSSYSGTLVCDAEDKPTMGLLTIRDVTENKRAEESLRQNEAKLRAVFRALVEGVVFMNTRGEVEEANDAVQRLHGHTLDELADPEQDPRTRIIRPDGTLFPPDEQPAIVALRTGEAVRDVEMGVPTRDGKLRWRLVNAQPAYDDRGNLLGAVASFFDITDRKQAEEALRKSEERFQTAVQNSSLVLAQTDRELRYTWIVNPHADFDPASVIGKRDDELDSSEGARQLAALKRQVLTSGFGVRQEIRFERSDGIHAYDMTIEPLRGPAGEIVGVSTASIDVTERRRAEAELDRERELLQAIYDTIPIMLTIYDPRMEAITINKHFERVTGWTPQDAAQNPVMELVYPDPEYRREVAEYMQSLQPGFKDIGMATKDGRTIETSWANVRIPDGRQVGIGIDITERKRDRARIESLARFPSENPYPVLRVDREGQILYANRTSHTLLAYWGCQVGERLPEEWRSVIADVFRSGSNREIEVTHEERVLALVLAPIVPAGYVNVYGRDVTQRNQAEQRLRVLHQTDEAILSARSAAEVAEIALEQLPHLLPCRLAGVVLLDLTGQQAELLAVYGATQTDLDQGWRWQLSEMWVQMASPLARGEPYVIQDLRALPPTSPAVRTLQAENIRAMILTPLLVQGTLIGVLGVGMPIPGPLPPEQIAVMHELANPLAIGLEQARLYEEVQGYARELEQRVRRRTAELETSQARFRAIFDEAPIGIALVDRQGRVLSANPALQNILNYSEPDLCRTSLQDLAHPESSVAVADLFAALAAGDREYYRVEQHYRRQTGESIDASVTMALIHPRRGRARFAVVLIEDITERKRAQQALVQSERLALAGRLAASLAHEINNPLQSVIGCLGLAGELIEEQEDASPYMNVAMEELQRASRIVHQMRDLGRREQGPKEPGDINERIEKVLLLTRKQCQIRRMQVTWQPGQDIPLVPMVGDRIQQVFLNLVINAVEAMPEGGELHITTARTANPKGVLISFSDSGVGISPEGLERLFEAFQSTKEQGLGLGLYVSHNIVQEHGGKIDVQSELGRGTTFTVWLPAE